MVIERSDELLQTTGGKLHVVVEEAHKLGLGGVQAGIEGRGHTAPRGQSHDAHLRPRGPQVVD